MPAATLNGRYDVIIVGAGSSGCLIAAHLSADPARSVLLLEAGPDFDSFGARPAALTGQGFTRSGIPDPEYDWRYQATLVPERGSIPITRGRFVGGSGAVNGSLFVRGTPEDFDAWGSPLWTFAEVLPYFRAIEADRDFPTDPVHGGSGPIPVRRHSVDELNPFESGFVAAAHAVGYQPMADLNAPTGEGVGPFPRNDPDGVRIDSAQAFLDPVRHRPNLTVQGRAMVQRILVTDGRAHGVDAVIDGTARTIEADQVILSAGGIGSPHLLLVSGIGPRDVLTRAGIEVVLDLPGVGRSLQDHPSCTVWVRPDLERVAVSENARLQTAIFYSSGADGAARHDMMLSCHHSPDIRVHEDVGTFGVRCSLELPDSVGELSVVSKDVAVKPTMDFDYLSTASDRSRLRDAVRRVSELADSGAFGTDASLLDEMRVLDSDDELDAWIRQNLWTSSHTSSTCAMGADPAALAVVDDRCRVHGVENLRVVDLSIAPKVMAAPVHASVIMMAARAADLIVEDLR